MTLDFTGSEREIVASIQAMIAHRMPSEKQIRLPGDTKASREAAYRENLEKRETFLQDWATFLVFLRDKHGFHLDLHEAWHLIRWDRLCELCDPQTLIGRSLPGRLMRKYLNTMPGHPYECELNFGIEIMTVAYILQSAIQIPTYPENFNWADFFGEEDE